MTLAARMVSTAPMGSTTPDSTAPERPAFAHALCPQGHRDDGSLREVLDGNAQRRAGAPAAVIGAVPDKYPA